ncbi:MAG: hypothetical protein JO015_08630 [Verrucomicrobia bacterium]|nr:hypothetical protein [Verrucomicrobiota bacterium]
MEESNQTSKPNPPPQLSLKLEVSEFSEPTARGSQPVAVMVVDPKTKKNLTDQLGSALGKLCDHLPADQAPMLKKKINNKTWKSDLTDLFVTGVAFGDQENLLQFAQKLVRDAQIAMPTTGAFWADPKVGQEKAKEHLVQLGGTGHVLAETALGELARNVKAMRLYPKPDSAKEEDFANTLAPALKFWGAVSAVYAEGLQGEVHVWIPRGLTVGSIFWNDELPVLWKLKREGKVTALRFHAHVKDGQWAEVPFEELLIRDAYLGDASGFNKGAHSLVKESRKSIRATQKADDKMQIQLARPIPVGMLKSRLHAALDRARQRLQQKANGENK